MKKVCLAFSLLIFIINTLHSQTNSPKSDVILTIKGEEMIGNIQEINDSEIKFSYKGEKLLYTLKKSDIQKITFGSGRIEVINLPKVAVTENNSGSTAASEAHNKIAILPFGLVIDNRGGSEEIIYKIQSDCYDVMSKKSVSMQYQDPRTTNAILLQKEITRENFRAYSMEELCHILGVEFIIQGDVTINKGAQIASTSSNTTIKGKPVDPKKGVWAAPGQNAVFRPTGNAKVSTTQTSTLTQKYQTSVTMTIFDEHGSKIFSREHQSFWPDQNAYKSTLEFLAKKTPIYAR